MKQKTINQDTRFVKNDIVKVPRSKFIRPQTRQISFDAGQLIPCWIEEVIPGDSHELFVSTIARLTSPLIKPIMGDLELCYWAFFVPNRIVWEDWESFITGFQSDPDWTIDVNLVVPTLKVYKVDNDHWYTILGRSVADYFGLPINLAPLEDEGVRINALPFRGICAIWNEWFRDEALQNSIYIYKDGSEKDFASKLDGNIYGINGPLYGGNCLPLNKKHDYFTSALPAPQKGSPVSMSIGGTAPVVFDQNNWFSINWDDQDSEGHLNMFNMRGDAVGGITPGNSKFGSQSVEGAEFQDSTGKQVNMSSDFGYLAGRVSDFDNFYADLSDVSAINVNDLRLAFQTQIIKETDARYGTRYKEYLAGHFGVLSADARLQIPEFLGSTKIMLNVNQVVQTSQTTQGEGASAQANLAAYSQTGAPDRFLFSKSFTEHGFIIVVGGVRISHRIYSQGINKMWSRQGRFDYYLPELAHIGEQPIKNKEIYAFDSDYIDDVFGYQEAWSEYKYKPNECVGQMRPDADLTLSYWNLAELYDELPTLSPEWIQEDQATLNRCLAYPSIDDEGKFTGVPQFILDTYWRCVSVRPMPIHSIPGLIDHSGRIVL